MDHELYTVQSPSEDIKDGTDHAEFIYKSE